MESHESAQGELREQESEFHSAARKEVPFPRSSQRPAWVTVQEGPWVLFPPPWGPPAHPPKVWPLPLPHQPQVAAENTQTPTHMLTPSSSFTHSPNHTHKHSPPPLTASHPLGSKNQPHSPGNPYVFSSLPPWLPSPLQRALEFGWDEEGM